MYCGSGQEGGERSRTRRPLVWLDRGTLNALLTEQLRRVVGCQGATIIVGASRNLAPGESNWLEFLCLVPEHSDRLYVRAVAGGVVSEARERYNVLDS